MCELLGLNANAPVAATFSFAGLAARGGLTGDHIDGFGLALHDGVGCRVFLDDRPASRSPLADFLQREPLKAPTVLAHVRKATQGGVATVNCHPFQRSWGGRHWVFAHNGDLKQFTPGLADPFRPVGQTDSERAFCWLLQRLERELGPKALPRWPTLGPLLHRWLAELAGHGTFNMLLSDGRALVAHASHRLAWVARRHPFRTTRLKDRELTLDLAQLNAPTDRMVVVATQPLTHDEPWQSLAPGETRVFADGRSLWSSHRPVQMSAARRRAPSQAQPAAAARLVAAHSAQGLAGC
jgi:predicted glutamine amidotransferase